MIDLQIGLEIALFSKENFNYIYIYIYIGISIRPLPNENTLYFTKEIFIFQHNLISCWCTLFHGKCQSKRLNIIQWKF